MHKGYVLLNKHINLVQSNIADIISELVHCYRDFDRLEISKSDVFFLIKFCDYCGH